MVFSTFHQIRSFTTGRCPSTLTMNYASLVLRVVAFFYLLYTQNGLQQNPVSANLQEKGCIINILHGIGILRVEKSTTRNYTVNKSLPFTT